VALSGALEPLAVFPGEALEAEAAEGSTDDRGILESMVDAVTDVLGDVKGFLFAEPGGSPPPAPAEPEDDAAD
jgi:hypothetical protein